MNRAIFLYVPELDSDLDNIKDSMESIVKSINPPIYIKYQNLFTNLSRVYFEFKKSLKETKYFDSISSRDFYHLIKNCAYKINSIDEYKKNKEKLIMIHIRMAIERNLAGFELGENEIGKYKGAKDSVMLFKQKYNEIMENDKIYKIGIIYEKYNIIDRINNNLKEYDTRYLMLFTRLSMQSFIINNILNKIDNKVIIEKSPFKGDNNNNYALETINKIKDSIRNGDTLILVDLSGIFDSLFDLFNQNWIKKDGKKYARISLGYYTNSLTYVNEKFKCIIILDKKNKGKEDKKLIPLYSRFEKHILTYENILKKDEIEIGKTIYDKIIKKLKINVDKEILNYNDEELIINFDIEQILGLIYCWRNEKLNELELSRKIYEKIAQILPQDILASINVPEKIETIEIKAINNIYFKEEKTNINDYIINNKNKFSIIYTFSS